MPLPLIGSQKEWIKSLAVHAGHFLQQQPLPLQRNDELNSNTKSRQLHIKVTESLVSGITDRLGHREIFLNYRHARELRHVTHKNQELFFLRIILYVLFIGSALSRCWDVQEERLHCNQVSLCVYFLRQPYMRVLTSCNYVPITDFFRFLNIGQWVWIYVLLR